MKIIQSGEKFFINDVSGTYDQLPQGNYLLKFNPREGYFLTKKEDFKLPKKIYGDHSIVNRWLTSWENNSEKNLGILLSGIKGTGKTITAQKFCIDSNLPVIIINEPFYENDFIDFITNPALGKCIIFIDEFEKIYSDYQLQYPLLSIMDGNYTTNLIFLLTVNDRLINPFLLNRLNRIKYRKSYAYLEESIMKEVIDDLLINKDHVDSVYKFFDKLGMCTFDLLVNLIKEMNLFKEDALVCGEYLNLEIEPKIYNVYELFNGKEHEMSNTSLKGDENFITLNRRELKYLPKFKGKGIEDENNHYNKYGWEIDLDLDECEIERTKTNIIITTKDGLKFKLIESSFFKNIF